MELQRDIYAQKALTLMNESSESIFLTGKAGTGKSTLIQDFITHSAKNLLLLASTGIAAINLGGRTIHSFFLFHPGMTTQEVEFEYHLVRSRIDLLKKIDAIVIDEISMVRADLLDCIDIALRQALDPDLPFGGKQMIFVGDLYQLPPIVRPEEEGYFEEQYTSPFFFSSFAYQKLTPAVIELQTIYRQEDQVFKNMLNKIRLGIGSTSDLEQLNARISAQIPDDTQYLRLMTTNADASRINKQKLDEIDVPLYQTQAIIEGDVPKSYYANDEIVQFKVGSQIMMIKNDKHWKNGTICKLVDYDPELKIAEVEIAGENYAVGMEKRIVRKPSYDRRTKSIINEEVGSFSQMPFKLARAITIHKSQGLTFDNVLIDFGKVVFAGGQAYVALSRVRSLDGLFLERALTKKDIHLDARIRQYMGLALLHHNKSLVEQAVANKSHLRFVYIDMFGVLHQHHVKAIALESIQKERKEVRKFSGHCLQSGQKNVCELQHMFDLELEV